jgi:drug/metabolite transporter (DMT)-like permease
MRMTTPGGWRGPFVALAAIWGSSFLFIKVLGDSWPPLWVALGRIALGALTLLAFLAVRRERLPSGRRIWGHLAVCAVLFNAVPFTLFAFGETKVPSVVAGLWNATTPLWTLIVVLVALPEEHVDRRKVAGLLLGFAGVAGVLGPWRGLGGDALIGHLACFGAALCYGLGFPYVRRHLAGRPESGVSLAAAQMLLAAAMLAVFTPLARAPTADIGLDGLGSLLGLGVLGSGVAYVINYAIVRAAGATIASTVTYLIPVFSTVLGVVVLGEPLTWNEPVGAAIVVAGIAVSQGQLRLPRRAAYRAAP